MNRLPSRAVRIWRSNTSLAPAGTGNGNLPIRPISSTFTNRQRSLHSSSVQPANPLPITATGPPPKPPQPVPIPMDAATYMNPRARLQDAAAPKPPQTRFWKAATPHKTDTHFEIRLDQRPLKVPTKDGSSKQTLKIPLSKPMLAYGIAIEWTLMRSNSEAFKPHMIPLTSMASRAVDLEEADATGEPITAPSVGGTQGGKLKSTREGIVDFLMGYLDTDTMLLISPTLPAHMTPPGEKSLRDLQLMAAEDMISWMHSGALAKAAGDAVDLPGDDVKYEVSDGDEGLLPVSQNQATHDYLRNFIDGLSPWQLVALEKAVMTGKSLLNGLRLVVENMPSGDGRWTIEDAARATTIEVGYQTAQWGEVEDTHDVDIADVRRGMGSVVLLVSEN